MSGVASATRVGPTPFSARYMTPSEHLLVLFVDNNRTARSRFLRQRSTGPGDTDIYCLWYRFRGADGRHKAYPQHQADG